MVDSSGACEHDVARHVEAGEEVENVVARHCIDRLLRPEHVTPEWMVDERRIEHEVVDPVRRLVVALEDLLDDHAAFHLYIVGRD